MLTVFKILVGDNVIVLKIFLSGWQLCQHVQNLGDFYVWLGKVLASERWHYVRYSLIGWRIVQP